jgi:hypothetical protein
MEPDNGRMALWIAIVTSTQTIVLALLGAWLRIRLSRSGDRQPDTEAKKP